MACRPSARQLLVIVTAWAGLSTTRPVRADSPAPIALTPSPQGFLTAWAVSPALSTAAAKKLATGGTHKRARLRVSPGPMVGLGKRAAPRRATTAWLEFDVTDAVEVELRFGADGPAEAYLDGERVGEQPYARRALIDDGVARLRLTPGSHRLAFLVRRPKGHRTKAWRLVARILDDRGRPPVGVTYRVPATVSATRDELASKAITATLTPRLVDGSAQVTVSTEVTGLAPDSPNTDWRLLAGDTQVATGAVGTAKTVTLPSGGPRTQLTLHIGSQRVTQRVGTRPRWLKQIGDIDAALAKLTDALPPVTRETLSYERERLATHVLDAIGDVRWLDGELTRLARLAETAARGENPLPKERGAFRRAYRSRFDGRLQHYSIHVPERYKGKQSWPLVVGLHGLGASTHMALRQVLGRDRDKEAGEPGEPRAVRGDMPPLPDRGVITVCPHAYGDTAFWFYGEVDVMRVIDEVVRDYRIDPSQIILTGLSLGGLGTYHIGHHFPDRFAALGPLGGYSSVKLYRQIRRHKHTAWETALIEQRDATSYAENGRHTPMFVVHGGKDGPRHARAMTDRYAKLGYRHELDIPEEMGHDVWQYSYGDGRLLRSLLRFRRPGAPKEVVFKTLAYRYRKAYWARLEWIGDLQRAAQFRGRVYRDRNLLRLDTVKNIRGLTVFPAQAGLRTDDGAKITLDLPGGQTLEAAANGPVHLRKDGDTWRVTDSGAPPKGQKRPGMSGPLDDIMFEPHRFVVGTQDPVQTDTNRRLVAEDRTYLRHRNHQIAFPVIDDVDLTDAQLTSEHLVIYGNSRSNSVLARLIDAGLPLGFDDRGLTLQGRRFDGENVGIKMIYPNPLAPHRYVVVVAGVTWRGTQLSRHLPRFLPDVVVYDERIASRYLERILIDRPVRLGAFFDAKWQLPAGSVR